MARKDGFYIEKQKKKCRKIRLTPEAGEPEQKMLRKDETLEREVLNGETRYGYDHRKS